MDILEKIIAEKHREVAIAKNRVSIKELEIQLANKSISKSPSFVKAIENTIANHKPAIIAEIKKASPSKGIICKNFKPEDIAKSYAAADATCLSVLTDEKFFQGSIEDLIKVRAVCNLPILRKDFIVDPYQVFQTKAMHADCLLLIVAALTQTELLTLHDLANELNLDVLIEVHDQIELGRALEIKNTLIGINNRNLKTFETSLQTTLDLLPLIPSDRIVVTESGIHTADDVKKMRKHGVQCFLVGESMMRADDPGDKLRELFC